MTEGFSGLNYVVTPGTTVNTQFVCEASPAGEARPIPPSVHAAGESPGVTVPTSAGPARLRCDVSAAGAAAPSQSVTLEATADKTVAMGAAGVVRLSWVNGRPPVDPGFGIERNLIIQLFDAARVVPAQPDASWMTQILFQLDPTAALTNPLRGAAALTGTATLRAAASITIGCTAD